ncbi:hypothetical protein V8G54_019460 [Vigna mungo]|uniref:Uncharacterized protein n=1 Tax=Vigna mungo TaxID=3915 RepID=A0AAQ3RSF9_VIGMU
MNEMLLILSLSFSSEIERLDLLVIPDSDTDTSEFASEKLDWSTPITLFPTFQPPKYFFNHTSSSLDSPGWCESPKGVNLAEEGMRERLVQVEADSSMVFEMVDSSLVALLDSVRFKPFGRGSLIRGFLLLYTPLDCSLSLCLLDIITCQWFFTALSVLPGNSLAIMAHLLPYIL